MLKAISGRLVRWVRFVVVLSSDDAVCFESISTDDKPVVSDLSTIFEVLIDEVTHL